MLYFVYSLLYDIFINFDIVLSEEEDAMFSKIFDDLQMFGVQRSSLFKANYY